MGFEINTPTMKMRYETFGQGNDYVGPAAAADDPLMDRLFQSLPKEWKGKFPVDHVQYVDSW